MDLEKKVRELIAYPNERNWFEFKENWYEPNTLGEYISSMSNAAASKSPTAFNGVRYLRIGSSKVNLSKYPERESQLFYTLRVGLPTICNTESEYQDLTFDKLFVYYASKGITLNKRSFKKNLGLLTENGKYNLMAQLVSDNSYIPIRLNLTNRVGLQNPALRYSF